MLLERLVVPIGFDTGLFMEGLDLIKNGLEAVGKATFDWAEQLDQLGDVTGMSNQKLAAWSYVAKKAGVPVSNLTKGLTILEKGLVKSDGTLDTVGKSLKDWGINVFGANGKIKDQSALMDEITKKYESFATQQQRVDFLTQVFGRSGAELVDVFDTLASEGGIDAVTKKIEGLGLVLDSSQYEGFNRMLNEIGLTFIGLANTLTGPLMPGLSRIVDKFREWLQTPWVINTLKGIGTTLGTLMDDIAIGLTTGDWSKFWGDANSLWEALKDKVSGALNKAATWIREHGPFLITDAIFSLFGMKLNIPPDKLTDAASNFVQSFGDALKMVPWDLVGQVIQQKIGEQLDQMSASQKIAGGGILGVILLGGIGPSLAALGKLVTVILTLIGTITAAIGATYLWNAGIWEVIGAIAFWAESNSTLVASIVAIAGASTASMLAAAAIVVLVGALWVATIAYVILHWNELKQNALNFFAAWKLAFTDWQSFMQLYKIVFTTVMGDVGKVLDGIKEKVRTVVGYIVERVQDAINLIIQLINLLPGLNVPSIGGGGGGGGGGGPQKRASGGPAAGWTWVGERGPELVNLPSGSTVYSNQQSQAMSQIDYDMLGRSVAKYLVPALQAAGIG